VEVELDGERTRCTVARDRRGVWVACRGRTFYLETTAGTRSRSTTHVSPDEVRSPMTGVLLEVRATPGSDVAHDQTLAVLEAMKMEYRLASPRAGRVLEVPARAGDRVELGTVVVRLEPESQAKPEPTPAGASLATVATGEAPRAKRRTRTGKDAAS